MAVALFVVDLEPHRHVRRRGVLLVVAICFRSESRRKGACSGRNRARRARLTPRSSQTFNHANVVEKSAMVPPTQLRIRTNVATATEAYSDGRGACAGAGAHDQRDGTFPGVQPAVLGSRAAPATPAPGTDESSSVRINRNPKANTDRSASPSRRRAFTSEVKGCLRGLYPRPEPHP